MTVVEPQFNELLFNEALGITKVSIITQVIIEILALSLVQNGVIFRYNHLRRGDYSLGISIIA